CVCLCVGRARRVGSGREGSARSSPSHFGMVRLLSSSPRLLGLLGGRTGAQRQVGGSRGRAGAGRAKGEASAPPVRGPDLAGPKRVIHSPPHADRSRTMSSINRPLAGPSMKFRLAEQVDELRREEAYRRSGRAGRTLAKSGRFRVTLVAAAHGV